MPTSSLLPTISSDPVRTILVPRRYWKFVLYFICVFVILATLSQLPGVGWDGVRPARGWLPFAQTPFYDNLPGTSLEDSPNYPPDYVEWHKLEEALPQHNPNLSFPEGREGRYVYFSEHVKSASIRIPCSG